MILTKFLHDHNNVDLMATVFFKAFVNNILYTKLQHKLLNVAIDGSAFNWIKTFM